MKQTLLEIKEILRTRFEILKTIKNRPNNSRETKTTVLRLEKRIKRQSMCIKELLNRCNAENDEDSQDNEILEKMLKDCINQNTPESLL